MMMPGLPGPGVALGTALEPRRDEYPAPAFPAPPGALRKPPLPTCHHCGSTATAQWKRQATTAETEQHWAALQANIRSIPDLFGHGNATYTADHAQDVTKAVFGCGQHIVDDTLTLHDPDCGGHGACQCEGTTTDG